LNKKLTDVERPTKRITSELSRIYFSRFPVKTWTDKTGNVKTTPLHEP